MSPDDDINIVISHGLSSGKGKSKNEKSEKVEQKYDQHKLTQCIAVIRYMP